MTVRALLLTAALALGLGLGGVPAQAEGAAPDLASLRASLTASAARAQSLADALEQAAARDGGLRSRLQDLAQESDDAQALLDARVRSAYIHGAPDPLGDLVVRVSSPTLPRTVQQGLSASVRTQRELLDAVGAQSTRVRALQARAAAFRADLRSRAATVLAEQDRARALLATARREAARQAALTEDAAVAAAVAATEQERLQEVAGQLDAVSASVTRSLTPAQTARGRRAQEREAPVLALLEATGSGYPAGYVASGEVVRGTASWYGPGFVGSPTASGAPYDPERLSCAHKTLPLMTVLRVSSGGRTVSCLVTDRGPYVGTRVLDMSRAGSRALGYDGTAEVVAEVLVPA